MKARVFIYVSAAASICITLFTLTSKVALSSLPPQDTPEEVLRTEIILEARSPVDGKPLSAAEYLEIQAQLRTRPTPKLNPQIRENIFLLRLRQGLRKLFPFINF